MRRLTSPLLLCLACGAPSGGPEETGSSSTSGTTAAGSTGGSSTTMTPTTGAGTTGGSEDSTGSGGGSVDDSSSSGDAFVVDCHTLLKNNRLAFACNIPGAKAACDEVPLAPCEDVDEDGLTDAWEDLLLAGVRPLRRMDEGEMLIGDPAAAIGDVGRVVAVDDHFRVYIMLGYHIDYGSCGFTDHKGDSERVALDLIGDPDGGPGGALVVGAYTAAHENTETDHGKVFQGTDLDQLVYTPDPETTDPRWVVFPSRNKHATYATITICENISAIPCLDEDCAPDDVDDPAMFDLLPEKWVNAGEEAAPRVTELSVVGFPGDQAWAEQDFCGGLGEPGCTSPVREKLTVDPF
jgi:hypothetical protein